MGRMSATATRHENAFQVTMNAVITLHHLLEQPVRDLHENWGAND